MKIEIISEKLHGLVEKYTVSQDKRLIWTFEGFTIEMLLTPEELDMVKKRLN